MVFLNNLTFLCFDFETGGLDPNFHEAIQIAGKAYNARTLEPEPDGEFCSLMKPLHPDRLQDEALRVNGKTRKTLDSAPDQKVIWNKFVDWVATFNRGDKGGRKTVWTAPIACGKNIRNFDLKFMDTLNNLHCQKKEKTTVFNCRRSIDLEDFIFHWFENTTELENEKMDTLREFFGLSTDGAHDALVDVRQTGDLIMKFLRLNRKLRSMDGRNGKLIKFGVAANAA